MIWGDVEGIITLIESSCIAYKYIILLSVPNKDAKMLSRQK